MTGIFGLFALEFKFKTKKLFYLLKDPNNNKLLGSDLELGDIPGGWEFNVYLFPRATGYLNVRIGDFSFEIAPTLQTSPTGEYWAGLTGSSSPSNDCEVRVEEFSHFGYLAQRFKLRGLSLNMPATKPDPFTVYSNTGYPLELQVQSECGIPISKGALPYRIIQFYSDIVTHPQSTEFDKLSFKVFSWG